MQLLTLIFEMYLMMKQNILNYDRQRKDYA